MTLGGAVCIYATFFGPRSGPFGEFSKMFEFRIIFRYILVSKTAQCGNFGNLLSRIFGKNFVKATFLLKKLVKR